MSKELQSFIGTLVIIALGFIFKWWLLIPIIAVIIWAGLTTATDHFKYNRECEQIKQGYNKRLEQEDKARAAEVKRQIAPTIMELKEEGLSLEEIADYVGASPEWVKAVMKEVKA